MRNTLSAILLWALMAGSAIADGILIPRPFPEMPPRAQLDIKYHRVNVIIDDPVATTTVDQVFSNPYYQDLEADYIFPIPQFAVIDEFTAWLDGHKMQAELLPSHEAARIYEEIVKRRKDPALLEYAGRGIYRLRVYPIPARGDVRIKISYKETLKAESGTVEYLYPLNTEKHSGTNLEECSVNFRINSLEDIGSVYCPTHPITVERLGPRSFTASYYERNVKPNKDLILCYTRQNGLFGLHFLTYDEPGEKRGYFMGIISPPPREKDNRMNKNLIFLLDSSGSMRGEKMEQAIGALRFCLAGLKEGDNFAVIDYDDDIRSFNRNLMSASKQNIADANLFCDMIEAEGGTNIYDALANACGMIPSDDNPSYIIFLTDGLPTVGNTNIENILANTKRLNEGRAHLFVFGVGYDVNAHLLDRLTEENRGTAEYVSPNEDIEVKVSRLATKISYPALTNTELAFENGEITDIYPHPLPDLFYGSDLIVFGRYGHGYVPNVTLKGKIRGQEVSYRYDDLAGRHDDNNEYIAMLWANRRIGYLIQQMRLHGTSDEILNEVIELSRKFGIVTEYTSYLVTGDRDGRHDTYWQMPAPEAARRLKKSMDNLSSEQSGAGAFNQSKNLQSQNKALPIEEPAKPE